MMGLISAALSFLPTGFIAKYWRAILEAVMAVFLVWMTWTVAGWRHDAQQKQAVTMALHVQRLAYEEKQRLAEQVGSDLERRLANAQKKVRTLNRKLSDEISAHDVYRQCRPNVDSLRFLNEAATSAD